MREFKAFIHNSNSRNTISLYFCHLSFISHGRLAKCNHTPTFYDTSSTILNILSPIAFRVRLDIGSFLVNACSALHSNTQSWQQIINMFCCFRFPFAFLFRLSICFWKSHYWRNDQEFLRRPYFLFRGLIIV